MIRGYIGCARVSASILAPSSRASKNVENEVITRSEECWYPRGTNSPGNNIRIICVLNSTQIVHTHQSNKGCQPFSLYSELKWKQYRIQVTPNGENFLTALKVWIPAPSSQAEIVILSFSAILSRHRHGPLQSFYKVLVCPHRKILRRFYTLRHQQCLRL